MFVFVFFLVTFVFFFFPFFCFFVRAPLIFGSRKVYFYLDINIDLEQITEEQTADLDVSLCDRLIYEAVEKSCYNGLNKIADVGVAKIKKKMQIIVLTAHKKSHGNIFNYLSYRIYGNIIFKNCTSLKKFINENFKSDLSLGHVIDSCNVNLRDIVNLDIYNAECCVFRYPLL